MTPGRRFGRAVFVLFFCSAPATVAQTSAHDPAAAAELFQQGRAAIVAKDYATACAKFRESARLDLRVGTLINLADCEETTLHLAGARQFWQQATALARAQGDDRADFAREHFDALDKRVPRLAVRLADAAPKGTTIERDGVTLEGASIGAALPVEIGAHVVVVSAPGNERRTIDVNLAEGETKEVVVEPGDPIRAPLPPETIAQPSTGNPGVPASRSGPGTGRVVAIVAGGAGILAVGIGAAFGATALSKNADSSRYCGVGGVKDDCYGPGVSLRRDAVNDATLSTILLGLGAVAVAGGIVLWVAMPAAKARATVGFDGRVLSVGGSF